MAKWDHLVENRDEHLSEGDRELRKLWRKYVANALPRSGSTLNTGWGEREVEHETRYSRALTRTGRYSHPSYERLKQNRMRVELPSRQASGAPHTMRSLGIDFEAVSDEETQELFQSNSPHTRITRLTGIAAASRLQVGDYIESVAGVSRYGMRNFTRANFDEAIANWLKRDDKYTKRDTFTIEVVRVPPRKFPATGQEINRWEQAANADNLAFDNYANRLYDEINSRLTRRSNRQTRFNNSSNSLRAYERDRGVTGQLRGPNGIQARVYMDVLGPTEPRSYDPVIRPTHDPSRRGYGVLHIRLALGEMQPKRYGRGRGKVFTCTGFVEIRISGPLYHMMVIDQTRVIRHDHRTKKDSVETSRGEQDLGGTGKRYTGLARGGLPAGVWKRHTFRNGEEILRLLWSKIPRLCRPSNE